MFSEYNNDTLASMVKSNPEFDTMIKTIIEQNKQTTSTFVHELRNPLSLLKGTVQYIESKHPEVKEFKYWDQMQDLINDMEHLMADVSLLNTFNYVNKENTDLITMINNIINSFMPNAITNQIKLSLTIDPSSEKYFTSYYCDAIKIKQAFGNLIKNALEATEPGNYIHISLKYIPSEEPLPSKLSFEFSNNGQPIPEGNIECIFNPFVTYKKGGTGVGLALVKKVVDLHYGTICVDSNPGKTTFLIQLPL
ncbi:HAMP domain-containing histidine kinase [Lachnospiraceae bacterium MD1]|uniref:histidine kinase n=1 Tax=Variimorphobacter saccharofermentans TaxID=2755051 RepID=A0A839K492_9FIRM|nr:HAMP domain-containing sensor histidine kinase [Variimorphobacter saccharofermentans]MBB2184684.1 HAMP domain-containing histidine kinase [Variimorphobacter saccharofermentans]